MWEKQTGELECSEVLQLDSACELLVNLFEAARSGIKESFLRAEHQLLYDKLGDEWAGLDLTLFHFCLQNLACGEFVEKQPLYVEKILKGGYKN